MDKPRCWVKNVICPYLTQIWVKTTQHCLYIAERIISLQNKNLLIIYPPPRHPRYSNLSSFSQKEFKAVEEGKKDFDQQVKVTARYHLSAWHSNLIKWNTFSHMY